MNETRIKNTLNILKKDLLYILIIYLITIIIFKIGFYKESLFSLARILLAFYWLFIIPGIFATHLFSNEMKFIERLFVGFGISAAVIGLLSYYIGLIGLHIRYHVILPLLFMTLSFLIMSRKQR